MLIINGITIDVNCKQLTENGSCIGNKIFNKCIFSLEKPCCLLCSLYSKCTGFNKVGCHAGDSMFTFNMATNDWYICREHPYRNAFYMRRGLPVSTNDYVYSIYPSENQAFRVLVMLGYERFCDYMSSILYEPMILENDCIVHAVGGYKDSGSIMLVHHRILTPEALLNLAENCPDSQIRIILIFPNGGTRAEDVWASTIISLGVPDDLPDDDDEIYRNY